MKQRNTGGVKKAGLWRKPQLTAAGAILRLAGGCNQKAVAVASLKAAI